LQLKIVLNRDFIKIFMINMITGKENQGNLDNLKKIVVQDNDKVKMKLIY